MIARLSLIVERRENLSRRCARAGPDFGASSGAKIFHAAALAVGARSPARYKAEMATKLATDEVAQRLGELTGWSLEAGKLHRNYIFADFVEAFGFMTRVALVAERLNHHPEWRNVWNTVTVDLVTHDAGGITETDFALAAAMERLA